MLFAPKDKLTHNLKKICTGIHLKEMFQILNEFPFSFNFKLSLQMRRRTILIFSILVGFIPK